jgi:hypothetical protein
VGRLESIWIHFTLIFSHDPIDDLVYVWWYDHEGAIQSHGINFVKDLPHFLVLLLCFERFTPSDWGIIPAFEFADQDSGHCSLSFLPSGPLSAVDITVDHAEKIRGHFGIVGRATQMLPAAISQSEDPQGVSEYPEGIEHVVKVYWPEESRVAEGEIINTAREIAEQNEAVKGHIPDLIHSLDFDELSTKGIRTALGVVEDKPKKDERKKKTHRVLRVILFRRLYPITDLTGEKFWKAFWECFFCECTSALCSNVLTSLRC